MQTAGAPIMGTAIQGSSAIIGPDGRILSEADTPNEKLIVADLDLSAVVKNKTFADASGHCMCENLMLIAKRATDRCPDSRPDMLWLGADTSKRAVVRGK